MSQLQFIDQQRIHYPVQLLCHVLAVVPSRYYAWCQCAVSKAEPAWKTALVDVFDEHPRRYGTRRLQVELRELGHRVGRQALRTAMRRLGPQSLAAQGVYAAHDRFDPRQALRSELAAQPTAPDPG